MKYIVFEVKIADKIGPGESVLKIPVVFPNLLVHSLVSEVLQKMFKEKHEWDAKPVSAGDLVGLLGSDIACGGGSDTLKLTSLGDEDTVLIRGYDYFGGVS